MFKYKIAFFILSTAFILNSCQPSLIKKSKEKDNIDSVLFYQKEDIPDPFLDGLLSPPDHEVVQLKKTITPKVKPKKFKEIDGFRVQVFASVDSFNALSLLNKLKLLVKDSVYLIHEKNLFKVQAGDFPYRQQADSLRELIKQKGYPGAWTVQRKILIPVKESTPIKTPASSPTVNMERTADLSEFYQIQVFATTSKQKAQSIVDQLSLRYDFPCEYRLQNQLYKVLLGRFATRAEAESVLKEIKALGFKDAWIVHQP
ncbi:SPOR domain-containing protein [Caldithrix abyssi]